MRDSGAVLPLDGREARGFDPERLLAPEQALIAYFSRVLLSPLGVDRVPLDAAYGRILAEDAIARDDLPAHPRSTMDGFALSSEGGLRRRIVGDVLMGSPAPRGVGPGEALRIPTGGALPDGADAVVPLEDVVEADGEIVLQAPVAAGDCLTQRGADMRAGETLLLAGRKLGGPEMGVLATLGIPCVDVFKRPRFGVISTGDELVDVRALPGAVVHGMRVKPGKPTLLGAAQGKPVLGLPGNPASALMILEAVVRPIVAACTGQRRSAPATIDAIAAEPFAGRAGWTWYVPARVVIRGGRLHAVPFTIRSSHVSLLARASGYATLGEAAPRVEAGETLRISLFSAGGAPFEVES